jgi:hypothetical protein
MAMCHAPFDQVVANYNKAAKRLVADTRKKLGEQGQ